MPLLTIKSDSCSQETSCEANLEHGSHLQILPSITILHVRLNTVALQSGLFKVAHSEIGRGMAQYCGSVAIVRISRHLCPEHY